MGNSNEMTIIFDSRPENEGLALSLIHIQMCIRDRYKDEWNSPEAELAIGSFQEVVRGIRNTRTSMNVPQNRKTHLIIVGKDAAICQMYENSKKSFANLAFAKEIHVQQDKTGIGEDAVSVVVSNAVVYMELKNNISCIISTYTSK